ncbi:tetratricopeptide repeat protein [Streptomyces europaeiscabiei]|uniref:tetratricopeptide repeat protein n=1 Tax=Streptomyces europaeiscabiei TaxID=146819 RepID=UPI0029ADDD16|nr:tetratricopeptide repeat protein [Streptomyces europaeiscabiei]MDX2770330.1 tetratricopeptide repeat protein [Streptomyces europaeiscabiei]
MERLLVDLSEQGRVRVASWRSGDDAAAAAKDERALLWPLSVRESEDLRWYLEDYLHTPFGVYEERGARVAASLRGWGEAVFSALFGAGPGREALLRARGALVGDQGLEVVIRSESAGMLGLPWEVMADPKRPLPLALDGVSFTRALPSAPPLGVFQVAGGRLRVLLVIARSRGERDVGYRMIARPLLERLAAVRGQVELVVLRPPSLARLREVLQEALEAGEPFQVVHFDGHGELQGLEASAGSGPDQGPAPQGVLAFEWDSGSRHLVRAEDVARVLAEGQVPVVVLNACRSAAMGAQVESAVATRLLQGGTGAVVAMAYKVYADAAAEFVAAFYEQLFAGEPVALAVAAGRLQLARENLRPSPKGRLPLADWMVPVLYAHRDVSFPDLRPENLPGVGRQPTAEPDPAVDRSREGARDGGPASDAGDVWAADGHFVGRDGLLHTLDATARQPYVMVVHGPGGIGKSQLAKAFGRWCRETGAVDGPECLVWHSFEPGVATFGLKGLVDSIGRALWGSGFAAVTEPGERLRKVEEALADRRVLVVCDNFESVHTMPDPAGATPALDARERLTLYGFLRRAASGRSMMMVTSRTQEAWLEEQAEPAQQHQQDDAEPAVKRIPVAGLNTEEASLYADRLLAPLPQAQERRGHRAFGELIQWLDGHPLAMRLILPRLEAHPAAVLLEDLRNTPIGVAGADAATHLGCAPAPSSATIEGSEVEGGLPGTAQVEPGRRNRSLAASIDYSFHHLPPADQEMLPVLALLHGAASAKVLGLLSAVPGVPSRFAGRTDTDWRDVLERAAEFGLLTRLNSDSDVFGIHPALPAYLAQRWCRGAYADERSAARLALVEAHAALAVQLSGDSTPTAMGVIARQRRTMGSMLGHALEHGLWAQAHAIIEPLGVFWALRGLETEASGWTERALSAVESAEGAEPDTETDAGILWVYLVGGQANRDMTAGRLDQAERNHTRLLHVVQRQPVGEAQRANLAACYHQLGQIAQGRGRLPDAEAWYRRSLEVSEELGDRLRTAISCTQLGVVAQLCRDPRGAQSWLSRALGIFEDLGDYLRIAVASYALGALAMQNDDLVGAKKCYNKARRHFRSLRERSHLARVEQGLGSIEQQRNRLAEAEGHYQAALRICEELQDRLGTASLCNDLGTLARKREQLADAKNWYQKALGILDGLGERPRLALTQYMLGVVTQEQKDLDGAEAWFRLSVGIREDLDDRSGVADGYFRLGLVARERGNLDEAEERFQLSARIREDLDDRSGLADGYFQLGTVARERNNLDAAEDRLRRSVDLYEALGNRLGRAHGYHQLGMVAQQRGARLTEAEAWLRSSLIILKELDHKPAMADSYHMLGMVLQERDDLDEAEDYYRKALDILVELGDNTKTGTTSYMLGMVLQERDDLDEAEDYYRKALSILPEHPASLERASCQHSLGLLAQSRRSPDLEEADILGRLAFTNFEVLGFSTGMAKSAAAVGSLAAQRQRMGEALEWAVRCVTCFEGFPHPATVAGLELLVGTAAVLGMGAVERVWRSVTGAALPEPVRAFLRERT